MGICTLEWHQFYHMLCKAKEALCSLNVRKLVIPAVPEMEKTWTTVFGFKPVEPSKKQKIKSVNLLIINGTGLLEKRLLPTGTVNGHTTARPANAVGSDKTDAQMFREASGSMTYVHVSREIAVADDVQTKYHENGPLIGSSAGEENEVKRTLERTSPVSVGDVKSHTLPGADSGDNVQFKAEADNIQERKYTETNGKLIAENTVVEQKCEDISNSSHANSLATPVKVDPCSRLSNEIWKGENCPSSEPSVEAAPITNKTESNLRSSSPSVHCANQEDEKCCAAPFDTIVPLGTTDEKPENHELKTMVADGYIQSSTEVKGSEDITNEANGTSIDAYIDKDTREDHSASAVECGVSMKGSVQQTEVIKDKIGSRSPDSKPSIGKDMLEKLNESKPVESDKVEMNDTTIKEGMTVESSNDAGITASTLDISNDVCGEVMAKHAQTCGEGQLHGDDGIYSNSLEDDLSSREPVNA